MQALGKPEGKRFHAEGMAYGKSLERESSILSISRQGKQSQVPSGAPHQQDTSMLSSASSSRKPAQITTKLQIKAAFSAQFAGSVAELGSEEDATSHRAKGPT